MAVVASMSSIIVFLAFGTTGVWKLALTDAAAHSADRLGYSRPAYRRLGVVEVLGAILVLAGLTATGASAWAILNEVAAAALAVVALIAVVAQVRARDPFRAYAAVLAFGALAVVELVFRLTL